MLNDTPPPVPELYVVVRFPPAPGIPQVLSVFQDLPADPSTMLPPGCRLYRLAELDAAALPRKEAA